MKLKQIVEPAMGNFTEESLHVVNLTKTSPTAQNQASRAVMVNPSTVNLPSRHYFLI
jgi:hypothetical protein